jgi:1,2-diacylglycerol 3-beta-glucosyltransferase
MAMASLCGGARMATALIGSPVGVLVVLCGAPVAACCIYLLILALASLGHDSPKARRQPDSRMTVIVPAHNEAGMIADCVRSLLDQSYPRDLYRIVVVADNCTDATAAVAEAAGAEVLVRRVSQLRGKGHALRWAMERLLTAPARGDAMVVVDADSIADPHFLRELEAVFADGHPVVQADDVLRTEPGRPRALLEAAALLLRNRVRLAGRARFGLPGSLCGNGMLLATSVLVAHPWQAFSITEDAEYALSLLQAGVPTTFAPRARVVAAPTEGGHGAYTQSLRWDGGRFALTREWMLPFLRAGLRRRDPALLSVALDLAVPPLGLLVLTTLVGGTVSLALWLAGVTAAWTVAPWLLALLALPTYLVVGLASCRVPVATYGAFLLAPLFLASKLRVYANLLFRLDGEGWVRTRRPAEAGSGQGESDTP